MIVDLLRNDLSRVSKPGSVKVPALFAVETYPTVHQMTSTVTSVLEEGRDAIDVLEGPVPLRLDHGCSQDQGDGDHRWPRTA
jgi:para-aminobenzoate synthetase/4-amino-4-deoxychorismate lyase